jgi:hypothetical protein
MRVTNERFRLQASQLTIFNNDLEISKGEQLTGDTHESCCSVVLLLSPARTDLAVSVFGSITSRGTIAEVSQNFTSPPLVPASPP